MVLALVYDTDDVAIRGQMDDEVLRIEAMPVVRKLLQIPRHRAPRYGRRLFGPFGHPNGPNFEFLNGLNS